MAVLGIRDMLVQIRIRTSNGSGSDSFLSTLRMKKKLSRIFFLITYPQAHYLQSLIYCSKDKFCVKI
jgi:hypothetical protein